MSLVLMVAIGQNALAAPCGVVRIPAVFSAGRAVATPVADVDHRTLHLWIDSDGGGFEFDDIATRYGTAVAGGNAEMRRAKMPRWSSQAWLPGFATTNQMLPVLRRAAVAGDPIFRGLDGQLGASWLQNRIWTFDYLRSTIAWRCDGSIPHHAKADEVKLSFAVDKDGKYSAGLQFPRLRVAVGGNTYKASLDTAATVALGASGVVRMRDSQPSVRATSFAKRSVVMRWHAEHPKWRYDAYAGRDPGVAAILVPEISTGQVRFRDVWFTTRPDDDVFAGDDVDLKLGPSVFGRSVLTIDYVHGIAIVDVTT